MYRPFTFLCVEAQGEATTVVVVAVVILVFVLPGVIVPDALSIYDACISIVVVAVPVVTRRISDVEVSNNMILYRLFRHC